MPSFPTRAGRCAKPWPRCWTSATTTPPPARRCVNGCLSKNSRKSWQPPARPADPARRADTAPPPRFKTRSIIMALLQISEPGESPAPHQRKLAVGIDLGTTNSLVAAVRSSTPEVLRDAEGQALLPSAVRYCADGKVVIGRQALAQQAADPFNTIVSVKRFMGRSLDDARASGAPYEFVDAPGMVRLRTAQGDLSPVEVS